MALIKKSLIDDRFTSFSQPAMQIIKVSSSGPDNGWFEKRGSYLTEKRAELEPVEDHTPVFTSIMGAWEKHGYNRNDDAWPEGKCKIPIHNPKDDQHKYANIEAGLEEQHPTFVKVAKVYRNHNNTDPELASGFVHSSNYNKDKGRVEAIAFFKNAEWEDEIEAMHNDKNMRVSMTARVENDVCSECGQIAKTPSDYCCHIKMDKGAILEDGHQVGMINNKPVFRDLSGVRMNADRVGYGLGIIPTEKQASKGSPHDICSKLAAIEKKIEADLKPISGGVDKKVMMIAKKLPRKEISDSDAREIQTTDPQCALDEFAKRKIVLPIRSFAKIVKGPEQAKKDKTIVIRAEKSLPGLFKRMHRNNEVRQFSFGEKEYTDTPTIIIKIAQDLKSDYSVDSSCLQNKRASVADSDVTFTCESSRTPILNPGGPAEKLANAYGNYVLDALSNQNFTRTEKEATIIQNYIK